MEDTKYGMYDLIILGSAWEHITRSQQLPLVPYGSAQTAFLLSCSPSAMSFAGDAMELDEKPQRNEEVKTVPDVNSAVKDEDAEAGGEDEEGEGEEIEQGKPISDDSSEEEEEDEEAARRVREGFIVDDEDEEEGEDENEEERRRRKKRRKHKHKHKHHKREFAPMISELLLFAEPLCRRGRGWRGGPRRGRP